MFLKTEYKIYTSIACIIVRRQTEERLANTCFRGSEKQLASNFSVWNNVYELFSDQKVVRDLVHDADTAFQEQSWGTNSVCIELDEIVGWAGTDNAAKYRLEDMEAFQPNRRSQALRIKLDLLHLKAPRTNLLTIVYELHRELDPKEPRIVIIVHSIYPGLDIGELGGDITLREQCVFFDWSHPGTV